MPQGEHPNIRRYLLNGDCVIIILEVEMKLEMLADCRHDSKFMKTSFQDELTDSEGYVFDNGFGTYKLVDRNYFSFVNFIAHQN